MSDQFSLANIGDLGKPATTLVEKVSEALGWIFEPLQMVRRAKAQATVNRVEAESRIEMVEIERRAQQRLIREQTNIEDVLGKAIPLLNDRATPENVSDDWFANFFEFARIISDEDLQNLWARVLAGEANHPGAFAKRTLTLIASIEREDAQTFTNLCRFNWEIVVVGPLIYDFDADIYKRYGITFDSLYDLESMGFLQFSPTNDFSKIGGQKSMTVSYFDRRVILTFPEDKPNFLGTGKVLLTRAGRQLAEVCGATPVEGFFEYVYGKWANLGLLPKQQVTHHPLSSPAKGKVKRKPKPS